MTYINLGNELPGIVSLLAYRPETAQPLEQLAEVLLRGPSTLERGERELIAAYVSELNGCGFCASSHGACAAAQLPEGTDLVGQVHADPDTASISAKLKALLRIAAAVRESGHAVKPEDIDSARVTGATDLEIHDTVLIAAVFSMFNRYVDGLATITPADPAVYAQSAERIVAHGYLASRTASKI